MEKKLKLFENSLSQVVRGRCGVDRASSSDALVSWFEPHSISKNTTSLPRSLRGSSRSCAHPRISEWSERGGQTKKENNKQWCVYTWRLQIFSLIMSVSYLLNLFSVSQYQGLSRQSQISWFLVSLCQKLISWNEKSKHCKMSKSLEEKIIHTYTCLHSPPFPSENIWTIGIPSWLFGRLLDRVALTFNLNAQFVLAPWFSL